MSHTRCDILSTVYTAIGSLIGFSGFVVFSFIFYNTQAGVWAFLSGIFAFMTFILHILFVQGRLPYWYGADQLISIAVVGILGFIAGLVGLVTYVILGVINNEGFPTLATLSRSYFIMAVWAGITLKWGASLAFFTRYFYRRLSATYSSLTS